MLRTEHTEISVKGARVQVPAIQLHGCTLVLLGRWLRIARIHDEDWIAPELIGDPERFIHGLKGTYPRADIFTFARGVSETRPQYPYSFEWEDAAAIPITTYADWWKALPRIGRKNVRRAARCGVVVERAVLDDALVRGIKEIYDETPVRQGRRFWHYGKDLDSVRRANATYLERSEFLAARHDGALIGFLKLVYVGGVARVMQILAKQRHADKRVSNALLAKAVEACCQRGVSHFIYGGYTYGGKTQSSLADFKRRNGFQRLRFPRYFVPLSRKGKAALALNLHLGLAHLVPSGMARFLLNVRAALYSRYRVGRRQSEDASGTIRIEAVADAGREHGAHRRDHPQELD